MSRHINRAKRCYLLSCARALRKPRVTSRVEAEPMRCALDAVREQMASMDIIRGAVREALGVPPHLLGKH